MAAMASLSVRACGRPARKTARKKARGVPGLKRMTMARSLENALLKNKAPQSANSLRRYKFHRTLQLPKSSFIPKLDVLKR